LYKGHGVILIYNVVSSKYLGVSLLWLLPYSETSQELSQISSLYYVPMLWECTSLLDLSNILGVVIFECGAMVEWFWRRQLKYSVRRYPITDLSMRKLTWKGLILNQGLHTERLTYNCLSCDRYFPYCEDIFIFLFYMMILCWLHRYLMLNVRMILNWEGFGRKRQSYPLLKWYPDICLEGLKKTLRNVCQDIWSLSHSSNSEPSGYEKGILTTTPWYIVGMCESNFFGLRP
jgi:hypothetical protein